MLINSLSKNPINSFCFKSSKKNWQDLSNSIHKTENNGLSAKNGQVVDLTGKIYNYHDTCFFRDDLAWDDFMKLLQEKFSNTNNKTPIYIYGCSEGQEAYTLSLLLKKYFKNPSENFSKIIAKDITSDIIEQNKSSQKTGDVLKKSDFIRISLALNLDTKDMQQYFEVTNKNSLGLKRDILDFVEYQEANILSDTENIASNTPAIVLARNMWPYIDNSKYSKFASKLHDRLQKGSLVVLGNFDYKGRFLLVEEKTIAQELIKAGFKPLQECSSKVLKWGSNGAETTNKPLIFEK